MSTPDRRGLDRADMALSIRRQAESDGPRVVGATSNKIPLTAGVGDHDGLLEQIGSQDWTPTVMA